MDTDAADSISSDITGAGQKEIEDVSVLDTSRVHQVTPILYMNFEAVF